MFKKLWERFLKDGGIVEVLITTFIVALFQFSITFDITKDMFSIVILIILDILKGISVGMFLFFVINVVEIRFESYTKMNEYKLTINTDVYLNVIKDKHSLIFGYFKDLIASLIKKCEDVQNEIEIRVNVYEIYLHIIHSSRKFTSNVISVDLDIDAWKYACELEDFDNIVEFYNGKGRGEDEKQTTVIRKSFEEKHERRRETDLTYNIYKNLTERIESHKGHSTLGSVDTVRRLIILNKPINNLTPQELVILSFFKRITEKTGSTIHNKYLINDGRNIRAGSDEAKALYKLQDIILFDEQIAYKEYILKNESGNSDGQIITKQTDVTEYKKLFDTLFKKGSEMSEIFK